STKPRKLYPEEIAAITKLLPSVQAFTNEARKTANESIREMLAVFLSKIEISPPEIPELVETIIRDFELSRISPTTVVGISAAEAIGRTATQTVLNTFHISGSAKNVSYGIEGLREMINVVKNRRNPSCTIVFKDRSLSYLDVLHKRRDIVGITVGRIVADEPDIDAPSNMTKYPWEKTYIAISGKKIPDAKYVMRLKLNLNMMFQYRITMERVCAALDARNSGVICTHSPLPFIWNGQRLAIVDIYPQEHLVRAPLQKEGISTIDRPSLIYLKSIVQANLDKVLIQGIEDITA